MLAEQPEEIEGWQPSYGPDIYNERIPGALDLGFYYSEDKEQIQVAKVPETDRKTHLYVVGATGTGKTKFLEFLIWQDLMNSRGFGVIDPHGDLIEDIKGFLACTYYYEEDVQAVSERVVLIDPTDPKHTVTFNPLEKIPGVSVAEQAGELVSSFRKIWADSWGARMEDLMRNTLIALGEAGLTLCEIPAFLTRRAFRRVVMENVVNPTTEDYFRRFDTLTDRAQVTWIEPVMNKVNAFLADDRMRQMFSSPKSSFQLRDVMDERKHLLIKLDKGKLKGSADLLGSLFMAKIQMTAFSRSGLPAHKRVPFYLYIDEFQNFATESFEVILSEARKYGLSLIMAHQSLSQIPDSLRGLILSSAGLQVFFRVNRSDAQMLAKEVFSYSGYEIKSEGVSRPNYWSYAEEWEHKTAELQQLKPRTCYAKHKIQGGAIPLHTIGIPASWEMLEMDEEEYSEYVSTVPIGSAYLRSRENLFAQSRQRLKALEQKAAENRESEKTEREPAPRTAIQPSVESVSLPVYPDPTIVPPHITNAAQVPSEPDPAKEREHRRLQYLIKQLAEKCGYLAVIEQPTADGQGRVDVGLVRDNESIACEICVTTPPEHELGNIKKCFASDYSRVIVCSPDKKSLTRIKGLCANELSESDQQRILFLEPAELALMFEEEAARNAASVGRVKGYKVNVNYQPLDTDEKKSKRQAVAQIILQSFRRDTQE